MDFIATSQHRRIESSGWLRRRWDGGRAGYALEKVWKARNRTRGDDLRRAVDALARADLALKSQPEAVHRVMLERLTVALCRWYGG